MASKDAERIARAIETAGKTVARAIEAQTRDLLRATFLKQDDAEWRVSKYDT